MPFLVPPAIFYTIKSASGAIINQVSLGSLLFPTITVVTHNAESYLPEYLIPGQEGSKVERLGSPQDYFELHGFFHSGSDIYKQRLYDLRDTLTTLTVPSITSGQYFLSGTSVYVDDVIMVPVAGKGYPYYEFVVKCKAV